VARTLPPSWERLQWGTLVQTATWAVWDYDSWLVLSSRDVDVARVSGALTPLSIFLSALASAATVRRFRDSGVAGRRESRRQEVTGIQQSATCDLRLAAYRGRSPEAEPLYAAIIEDAEARGEGLAVHLANWAAAVLRNSQGRTGPAVGHGTRGL
jgi:hypothetical protein